MQNRLSIGEAITVRIPKTEKLLIYSPTMVYPSNVASTDNAKLSFIPILEQCKKIQRRNIQRVNIACPGLCTLSGGMEPAQSAKQMLEAYIYFNNWISENGF